MGILPLGPLSPLPAPASPVAKGIRTGRPAIYCQTTYYGGRDEGPTILCDFSWPRQPQRLSVGWPGYKWSELSEVLLYPDNFDRDYSFGGAELAGQAHVWGTVILSVPSLRHSFAYYEDPYHVGMHEFAHLLTYERGKQTEVPVGLPAAQIQLWEVIQADELKRIAGGKSIVSPYARQPSEFFPCAVEAFFQNPVELRDDHRRLYQFLSRYFRQRPAL